MIKTALAAQLGLGDSDDGERSMPHHCFDHLPQCDDEPHKLEMAAYLDELNRLKQIASSSQSGSQSGAPTLSMRLETETAFRN
jgi:hypothetical protein